MIDARHILTIQTRLQAMKTNPVKNIFKIRRLRRELQATVEGAYDVTTTNAVNTGTGTQGEVDKNNYKTYARKVTGAVEMYDGISDYGGEVCRGVTDTRTAFICGEGLSVIASKKSTQKFIDEFLKVNKLNGSRLIDMVTGGELEGKNLAVLNKSTNPLDKEEKIVTVNQISWYKKQYTVYPNPINTDNIDKIVYTKGDKEVSIPTDRAVWVKLGGRQKDVNETYSKLHNILTDIENFSRAKYDLRKNTHVFGKYMPYWKTATAAEAKAINNDIVGKNWDVGAAYAGTGDFSLVEPSGQASEAIVTDMLQSLKCVSLTLGIPIHFMAYPELMSNRATADNLMELIKAATAQDRLIWEEKFEELIHKAIIYAVDEGIADNNILGSTIEVKLPFVSIAMLKQIIEVWYPLLGDDVISMFTFMNMLPGIDPSAEKKLLDKEREERAENSPLANNIMTRMNEQTEQEGEGEDDPAGNSAPAE